MLAWPFPCPSSARALHGGEAGEGCPAFTTAFRSGCEGEVAAGTLAPAGSRRAMKITSPLFPPSHCPCQGEAGGGARPFLPSCPLLPQPGGGGLGAAPPVAGRLRPPQPGPGRAEGAVPCRGSSLLHPEAPVTSGGGGRPAAAPFLPSRPVPPRPGGGAQPSPGRR